MNIGHEGRPVEGVIIRLTRQLEREEANLRNRFALTQDSDSDDGEDDVSCSYYVGEGRLVTGNCTTLYPIMPTYVDCEYDFFFSSSPSSSFHFLFSFFSPLSLLQMFSFFQLWSFIW